MRYFVITIFSFVCLVMSPAYGATEWVYVEKAMDDSAIVKRSNGQTYLIDKGVGCLSLWRMENKRVLINSPGLFLGVGTKLLIPDLDQECRVWESELLSSSPTSPQESTRSPRASSGSDCESGHWIKSITGNGEVIVLEDNSVWSVSSIDTIYTAIWLPISNIIVCGSTMINTDDGEKVTVTRLK
jgi:hypothetical protein